MSKWDKIILLIEENGGWDRVFFEVAAILLLILVVMSGLGLLAPRLVGTGCEQGSSIQFHDEEDEFPTCETIERL